VSLRILTIKISQWARISTIWVNFYNCRKNCFRPWKNSPFPLAQAYNYILILFLAIVVKNLQEILAKLTILTRQRDNTPFWLGNVTTSTREPLTCAWICADIWRQDGAICSKNRKNGPYHGCARILRLTFSIPDYGSCCSVIFYLCKETVLGLVVLSQVSFRSCQFSSLKKLSRRKSGETHRFSIK